MWAADVHVATPPGFPPDPLWQVFQWVVIVPLAGFAIGMIVIGVHQHRRYRRLERRLAALREAA